MSSPCTGSTWCSITISAHISQHAKKRCPRGTLKTCSQCAQRRTTCWHVWIRIVSAYKIIFYKDRRMTPAAFTFPTQPESFKAQHAQNEIPSPMYYIDFIIDYLPRVTIWKAVRHNFFQLICLPGQLLLTTSNFPIDDDSTVKDGSSTVIIHFHPVGCNSKLCYT